MIITKRKNPILIQSNETNSNALKKEALQKFSWMEYFSLVLAGLLGVVAALPYTWNIIEKTATTANIPVQLLVGGQLLQSAIWMFLTVGIGLLLSQKTGLAAPILRGYLAGEQVGGKLRSHSIAFHIACSLCNRGDHPVGPFLLPASNAWFFKRNFTSIRMAGDSCLILRRDHRGNPHPFVFSNASCLDIELVQPYGR
jgi:hypothetical protein